MLIGIGCTVPEIVNLPGQSGGVDVALDYSLASACNNNSAFSPSQATPSGGVFSATPSGLNINSSTGEVTPIGSTPQAYVIAYTVSGSTSTFDLTIKPLDNATFSYLASSFPQDGSDPSPVFTSETITGGTFSATPSGLSINTSTGEINLSASTAASYTITYDTASSGSSVCPNTSNVSLAVTAAIPALAQVNNVYSMEFDGTNDYIDLGTMPAFSADFTWSAWIYPTIQPIGTVYRMIYTQGTSANAPYFALRGTKLHFYSPQSGVYETIAGFITYGQWSHVSVVRESNVINLYKNGVVEGSGDAMTGAVASSIGQIGKYFNLSAFWNGKLDEVALFNTALTATQLLSIYNATEIVSGVNKTADLSQLTTPPVKWYRMGD